MEGTLGTEIAHGWKTSLMQFDNSLLKNLALTAEVQELAAALDPRTLLSVLRQVGEQLMASSLLCCACMCVPCTFLKLLAGWRYTSGPLPGYRWEGSHLGQEIAPLPALPGDLGSWQWLWAPELWGQCPHDPYHYLWVISQWPVRLGSRKSAAGNQPGMRCCMSPQWWLPPPLGPSSGCNAQLRRILLLQRGFPSLSCSCCPNPLLVHCHKQRAPCHEDIPTISILETSVLGSDMNFLYTSFFLC